jgi:archaellum component FlaF (FlaF/FlaG flagellin family)
MSQSFAPWCLESKKRVRTKIPKQELIEGGFVLIGKIIKSSKQRLMVTVEDRKGSKIIDLRTYNIINDGELMPTPDGISLVPENIDTVVNFLREAQKKILESN